MEKSWNFWESLISYASKILQQLKNLTMCGRGDLNYFSLPEMLDGTRLNFL